MKNAANQCSFCQDKGTIEVDSETPRVVTCLVCEGKQVNAAASENIETEDELSW